MATDFSAGNGRIVALRGGALGDFVVTVPALRALRAYGGGAPFELWCREGVAGLAQAAGLADRVVSLDGPAGAALFAVGGGAAPPLRDVRLAVSFLHDPDGVVARNLRQAGAGQVLAASPAVTACHATEHFLRALGPLGLANAPSEPSLALAESVRAAGREQARMFGGACVALHPGSGSVGKNWPLLRFLELAMALRETWVPVFVLGEAEEAGGLAEHVAAAGFRSLRGRTVPEVAGFLAACCGYVGNDSGVSHLAAALGVPVVAVFGPTDPALWAPRGPNVTVLQAEGRVGGDLAALGVADVARTARAWAGPRGMGFQPVPPGG